MVKVFFVARMVSFSFALLPLLFVAKAAAEEKPQTHVLSENVTVELAPPVVVATSAPGEMRWGHYQFVSLGRYPDGRILCRFHDTADAVHAYGDRQPSFVSADEGTTWKPLEDDDAPPTGITGEVFDGEFLCAGSTPPMNLKSKKLTLPESVGGFRSYGDFLFFKAADCPPAAQQYLTNIPAYRWSPKTNTWQPETIGYQLENALAFTRVGGGEGHLLPRTWLECTPLKVGKELLYADYRQTYLNRDGSVLRQFSVQCMVSTDNGRSFQHRATIYTDPEGVDAATEPMLAQAANGELVCVIRRTDQRQMSMLMTYSKDQGRTWEKPTDLKQLGNYGVWPRLLSLDCGVMVLSYGRPGVRLAFSLAGNGQQWTEPVSVIAGDPRNISFDSCGYSTMVALNEREFLLGYADFQHKDDQGKQRKAIMVRKVALRMRK